MIKACLFDLDGTLLDTLSSIAYHLNGALERHGIKPLTLDKVREFVGYGARILLRKSLIYRGYSPETNLADEKFESEIFSDFYRCYTAEPSHLVAPYKGIPELISELKDRGIALAVVSNKPHPAAVSAVEDFFPKVFSCVLGSKDGVPLKPSVDMPYAVCQALGVSPEETLYFGDSEIDMITAKAYGAKKAVGVSWGFRSCDVLRENGADVILNSAEETLVLLNS